MSDTLNPTLESANLREMVRQLRALDAYGIYDDQDDSRIIAQMVLTREQAREIPVVGDPDEIVLARVKAYYNALSCLVEQRCGKMATPVISLTHEGFGRVLIVVGSLVVLYRTLRDVHRFGFRSLDKLDEEAGKIVARAAMLVEKHPDVAAL